MVTWSWDWDLTIARNLDFDMVRSYIPSVVLRWIGEVRVVNNCCSSLEFSCHPDLTVCVLVILITIQSRGIVSHYKSELALNLLNF